MKKRYYTNFFGLNRYLSGQYFQVWEDEELDESHVIITISECYLIQDDEGTYIVKNPSETDIKFEIKNVWIMHRINS